MAVDFKSLGKFEQGALIAGGLSIILSFFPRYQSVDLGVVSGGFSAWHSTGVLGMLLVIAATGIIAAKVFAADSLPDTVPWTLVALAAAGLGTIILIIRGLTWSYANPGWSGYLLFLTTIALTAFTFLLFKESGEKMPDLNKKNDTPPAPPAA